MRSLNGWRWASATFALFTATAIAARAQNLDTIVKFDGADGKTPHDMSLVQGTDGNLYGTTPVGGSRNQGTIFRISRDGGLLTLYSFCGKINCSDGAEPYAGLVLASDGNFYGTTEFGGVNGYGSIFRITPKGTLTTLYSFCSQPGCADGSYPLGGLVEAIDGRLYGTSQSGGDISCLPPSGCGTVFKITRDGSLATLHNFDSTDGSGPAAGLIQATDGNFYGTTARGGSNSSCWEGCGTVFKVTPGGMLTTLHSFDNVLGAGPEGALVQVADKIFYGTTVGGTLWGVIFKISASGQYSVLFTFRLTDGGLPFAGLVEGTDGNLYGTTWEGGTNGHGGYGYGTIFNLTSENKLTTLYTFCVQTPCRDGANPYGGLVQATNGKFYGSTSGGGIYKCNCGTVYSLDMGLGPFVSLQHYFGRIGDTGSILGQGFTGTTSVALNGTPASFTVVSDTHIRATVPIGATTGYVTVATPTAVLTSNLPFHVIQ